MRRKAISPRNGATLWVMVVLFLFVYFIFGQCLKVKASESNLVVSEIMYDVSGADTGHEWIEIYNTGTEAVLASSTWRFFDVSNHKINLYQGTSTIASNEFFVLADNAEQFILDYPEFTGSVFDTIINLPNASSSVALSFDEGLNYNLREDYDSLWGGNGNGFSLEKIDLVTNSSTNWQESSVLGGTPGKINSEKQVEDEESPPTEGEDTGAYEEVSQDWSGLLINELLPNPEGSDDGEWIELYNNGSEILNLKGLKIKDNATRVFTLDTDSGLNLDLSAHNYLLIPKSISGISLNNSGGDGVFIMDPDNNIIDSVLYNDTAIEGRSYAKSGDTFVWSKTVTPGAVNQIFLNQAPVAQISIVEADFVVGEKISFSASLSYDPDGEDLDYLWEFGDDKTSTKENIKHEFVSLGTYTITLTVTDSEGAQDRAEYLVTIDNKAENTTETSSTAIKQNINIDIAEDDLIISEFIPNPIGSDDSEWIELYNASDKDIDLYAWSLDDEDGGSKPWSFASSTIILAKDYLVLGREDTKITLNNSNDAVRLISPLGDIWQEVSYEKIPEGKTYAWDSVNNEWSINEPSSGLENIFVQSAALKNIYNISDIKDLAKNDFVLVQGVALNNIDKDSRSLYLVDYNFVDVNFEEVVEIYSYYKNFPDIKAGDLVTISGQISRLDELPRIKIKASEDIWKNDVSIKLSEPEIVEIEDVDEDLLGAYLNIKAIVVKKSGNNIYLAPDSEEEYLLRVYSKFSTKSLEIKKGDEIIVAGILSETDSGFKLVPFAINDIAVSKQVLGAKINAEQVEVTDISTSTSQVITKDNKKSIKNILIFILIGLAISSLIYYIKNKKRKD